MDNLLTVTFEAHHPEQNHHRRYQLTLGRDLFDDWTVAIRYGRTGQAGRELRYSAADAEDLRAIIRERLRRRLSAPRRIGCPYRLTAMSTAPGFAAADWLPGAEMARFFHTMSSQSQPSHSRRESCHSSPPTLNASCPGGAQQERSAFGLIAATMPKDHG